MSTPSSAIPNMPAGPSSQPALSEVERVIDTFIAPRKTFMDLRRSASWWLPFILGAIATVAFILTVQQKIGWEAVVNYRFSHASFMQRIPPQQKQAIIDKQVASAGRSVYTTPVLNLVIAAIFAALLLATFNFGLDAQLKYKTVLAVVIYGYLPKLVWAALAILVMFVGVEPEGFDMENPVATHLGAILGSNTDSRYLYHFLASFDLISIWCIFLMGLGMAVIANNKKVKLSTAVACVALWYVVGDLIRVALTPFAG
jgi:hypothetical protein